MDLKELREEALDGELKGLDKMIIMMLSLRQQIILRTMYENTVLALWPVEHATK